MLEAVGLTPTEEQVYRLLFRAGAMSTAELCQRLALSSEQADVVLGNLAAKGLITSTSQPSERFIAAPVAMAGEALLHRRFEELQAARLEFAKIAEEYCPVGSRPVLDGMIEIVPREAVPALFEQFQRNARSDVWTIAMPPYAVPSDKDCTSKTSPLRAVCSPTARARRASRSPLPTDKNGKYSFWAPAGASPFDMTASAVGWIPQTATSSIRGGKTTTVNFTLRPTIC